MKYVLISILTITLIGCKEETAKEVSNQQIATTSMVSDRFNFDAVTHYHFKDLKEEALFSDAEATASNRVLNRIATEDNTFSLADTLLFSQIEAVGFQKEELPRAKVHQLSLYLNKEHHQKIVNECLPVYRDILLLKKHNKITHILKVCFECLQTTSISKDASKKIDLSNYPYFERLLKE